MCPSQRLGLTARFELFERKLPDDMEHPKSRLAVFFTLVHQALVHQPPESIQQVHGKWFGSIRCDTHRLRRIKRTATYKHRQPAEQSLFLQSEQIIAPGEGVTHRLLPLIQVARAAH